jgi:hypothetical protein
MRLAGTKLAANHQYRGFGDQLYDLSGERPSLDLNFASTKSLVDSATSTTPVTFTRASSGTYVDSQGVIRTATTNLLLRSEEFGTTWATSSSTISPDASIAPNGTTTADLLYPSTSGTFRIVFQGGATANLVWTTSVYAKSAGMNWIVLGTNTNTADCAWFNLNTGTIGTKGANITSHSITGVGNGWYRCAITFTANVNRSHMIAVTDSDNTATATASGTSGILIWGAQLKQSSTVGEYIPTTSTINSAPRFDHNPTTGESLGLLVEEQRTNLCPQSEDFSANQASDNVSISANQIAAPDGTVAADLVTSTLAGSSNTCWVQQIASIAASASTYTSSFYAKQGTSPSVTLNVAFTGGTYTEIFVRFDFSTKSVSIGGGGAGAATAGYQQLQNGWFRIWAAFPNNNTGTAITHRIYTRSEGATNVVGDSVYLWGRMTEAGAFPTSYIPTTTATATRSADVASITGANFSPWYRQDEGTVFAETQLATNRNYSGTFRHLMQATPASNNDSAVGLFVNSANQFSLQVRNNNANQAVIDTGTNSGLTHRVAGVYKVDDFAISANGGSAAVDISGSAPTTTAISQMTIGGVRDGNTLGILNGTIRRLTYWPQRLPNSTLQQITQ